MAEAPWRLFVAVPLPAASVEATRSLIEEVRAGPLGRVPRWVHVDTLHLTVRFLGETPPDLAPDVAIAVRDALAGWRAFDVELAGAGMFPGPRKPRTLWLGIEHGAEEMGALADALDAPLEPLGWPADERAYRPHLTVARLDASSPSAGVEVAGRLVAAATGWRTAFRADRVVLYRSRLGDGSPRHEPLVEIPLAG
ncbi:MAG: RNA 2',3'-cyclic phosphodiesterase [Chloroflexota bacterium]